MGKSLQHAQRSDRPQRRDDLLHRSRLTRRRPRARRQMTRVYRLPPGATTAMVVDATLSNPNGITLSLDETFLYRDRRAGAAMRYPGQRGRQHRDARRRSPQSAVSGGDGMGIDCPGNLYVTTSNRLVLVDPTGTGTSLGIDHRQRRQSATNVAFGGAEPPDPLHQRPRQRDGRRRDDGSLPRRHAAARHAVLDSRPATQQSCRRFDNRRWGGEDEAIVFQVRTFDAPRSLGRAACARLGLLRNPTLGPASRRRRGGTAGRRHRGRRRRSGGRRWCCRGWGDSAVEEDFGARRCGWPRRRSGGTPGGSGGSSGGGRTTAQRLACRAIRTCSRPGDVRGATSCMRWQALYRSVWSRVARSRASCQIRRPTIPVVAEPSPAGPTTRHVPRLRDGNRPPTGCKAPRACARRRRTAPYDRRAASDRGTAS